MTIYASKADNEYLFLPCRNGTPDSTAFEGDKTSFSDRSGSWLCYTKLLKFLSVSADTLVEMEGDLTLMICVFNLSVMVGHEKVENTCGMG
jgi:hypothetical protein